MPVAPREGYPDAFTEESSESLLGLALNLVGILRRNWWLVFITTAAAVGIAVYRLRQERPLYQATAVIRLKDRSPLMGSSEMSSAAARIASQTALLSQIQVLQSRAVARQVADSAGLRLAPSSRDLPIGIVRDPHVPDETPNGSIHLQFGAASVLASGFGDTARSPYGSPVTIHGVAFSVASKPTVEFANVAVVPLEDAATQVFGRLRGTVRANTDIIDVSYVDYDSHRAQRVVNDAVRVFQAMDAQSARQDAIRRRQFIEQQLQRTQALADEAEMAQTQFKSKEQVARVQGRLPAIQQGGDASAVGTRRQELKDERDPLAAFLASSTTATTPDGRERLASLMAVPNPAPNPAVSQAYAQLSKLQETRDSLTIGRFARSVTDPDVRRLDLLIARADSGLFRALHAQLTSLDTHLAVLDSVQQLTVQQLAEAPQNQVEQTSLSAQVESYRRQADGLRTQLQAAQIDEAAQAGQIEIVDFAPRESQLISNQRDTKIALAVLIGLALGLVAGYVKENHSPVIRRRQELEQVAPVPNLALVPRIRSTGNGKRKLLVSGAGTNGNGRDGSAAGPAELVTMRDGRSTGAEAYRTLRTNILFSAAVQSLKRIVITSAGPGEGKTMIAANLATAFAQQGHRVLIIDCDLRRPRIHRLFGYATQPGLTDVLLGNAVLADAVRRSPDERLFVLTAGPLPPNPAELLGSSQVQTVFDQLSQTFDLLIFDTPPLLAASDAAILGRIADGTLLVVRAGSTQRSAITEALNQLERVGARIIGTVLNDPDAEVAKYAPYYQYYYNNYYDYSSSKS